MLLAPNVSMDRRTLQRLRFRLPLAPQRGTIEVDQINLPDDPPAATVRALGLSLITVFGFFFLTTHVEATEVSLAGLAYAGTPESIAVRFPLSKRFEASLQQPDGINALVRKALDGQHHANIELIQTPLPELKGRDQAAVVAMVVTGETASVERFGRLYKLLLQVRAQALFFDFKSMTVLRAYPFSLAYLDTLDHEPTQVEKDDRVRIVFLGAQGKPGLFARFADVLSTARLPSGPTRFLQVTNAKLQPDAFRALSGQFASNGEVAETWLADMVSEAISSKTGVPLIPYAKGYAVGNVMSMQVADGDVYTLKLPSPDYAIAVELTGLKKVKYATVPAGTSFIYASYLNARIDEPLSGHAYLDAKFKNGEVKLVPATQQEVDDAPAYTDSIRGLFTKLAEALGGGSNAWIKSAASSPDIENQIIATTKVLQSCK
jgi:hypothetical protein